MNITLRLATIDDAQILTKMNVQLIDDESSRNPMNCEALLQRMTTWLQGEYTAVLFSSDTDIVGYALYRQAQDEYFPDKSAIYLRQFFIRREHRRMGIGRKAYEKLSREFFSKSSRITLEVLQANPAGRAFWEKIGFKPYSYTLCQNRDG